MYNSGKHVYCANRKTKWKIKMRMRELPEERILNKLVCYYNSVVWKQFFKGY